MQLWRDAYYWVLVVAPSAAGRVEALVLSLGTRKTPSRVLRMSSFALDSFYHWKHREYWRCESLNARNPHRTTVSYAHRITIITMSTTHQQEWRASVYLQNLKQLIHTLKLRHCEWAGLPHQA